MAVAVRRQTEMPGVVFTVAGLPHAAQQQLVDHPLLGMTGHPVQHRLQFTRIDGVILQLQTDIEMAEEFLESLQFFQLRRFVDAVQQRYFPVGQKTGHGLVGGQHEFLDDAVRQGPLGAQDLVRTALQIQHDFRFRQIEVETAAPTAHGHETFGQFGHDLKLVTAQHQGGIRVKPILQGGGNFPIGQACTTAHDSRIKTGLQSPTIPTEEHFGHQGQPILIRSQGTDAVAQRFRQHGETGTGKIDAGGPFQGLDVDGAALRHIVADISNGHPQANRAPLFALYGDGVVEVLGRFAVDGHNVELAEIGASLALCSSDDLRNLAGQVLNLPGKAMGQVKLVGNGENFDLRVGGIAQHLHHGAQGTAGAIRIAVDTHQNQESRERLIRRRGRQGNGEGQGRIAGYHHPVATALLQPAEQLLVGTIQHPNHLALHAAARRGTDLDGDPIAVHNPAQVAGRNENIRPLPLFRRDKPVTVTMHRYDAGHHLPGTGRQVVPLAGPSQQSLLNQSIKQRQGLLAFLSVQVEVGQNLPPGKGFALLAPEQIEEKIRGGNHYKAVRRLKTLTTD